MTSTSQRVLLWGGAIVAIIGIFALLLYIGRAVPDVTAVTDSDWVQGNKQASVILTEYGDFQCPACGNVYPWVKQAQKDFGDKLALVFREFPLTEIHPNAQFAAWTAEAAGKQNKFWEMHDKLYESRPYWETEQNPEAKFSDYADGLGLNKEQFLKDYLSEEVHQKVQQSRQDGDKAGISGTPTFFVNGKILSFSPFPQTYDQFKEQLTRAIEKSGK